MRRDDFYRRGTILLVAVQFLQTTILASALPLRNVPERLGPAHSALASEAPISTVRALPLGDFREVIPGLIKRLVPASEPDVSSRHGQRQTINLLDGGLDLTVQTLSFQAPTSETPDPFRKPTSPAPMSPKAPDPRELIGRSAAQFESAAPQVEMKAWDWSYRLEQVSVGTDAMYHISSSPNPEYMESGSFVIYPRSHELFEVYEPRATGVEQCFVLTQAPRARGDMVLAGNVRTELAPRTTVAGPQGIVYEDPATHQGIVTYGAVTVIDSKGRTTSALTYAEKGRLETRVSGDWLAKAAYPVVIDPLVDSNFQVSSISVDERFPSHAYNNVVGEYMVVWEHTFSANDHDIYGQRVAANGTLLGSRFAIRTSADDEQKPKIAYSPTARKYFVAMHYEGKDIVGVLLNEDGTTSVGAFYIDNNAGQVSKHADVVYRTSGDDFFIAWSDSAGGGGNSKLYGELRNASDAALLRDDILLRNVTGTDLTNNDLCYNSNIDEYFMSYESSNSNLFAFGIDGGVTAMTTSVVTVSSAANAQELSAVAWNSTANEYLVVYESGQDGTGNDNVYGQRIEPVDGGLLGSNFVVANQSGHEQDAEIAFNVACNSYLVVFDHLTGDGDWDIEGQEVNPDGTLDGGIFAISQSPSSTSNEVYPYVVYNSSAGEWMSVWADGRNGTDFNVWGQRVNCGAPNIQQEPKNNAIRIGALGSVYGHSGEFTWTVTDLRIPGRGHDFIFQREYRSGSTYSGPLGFGWDFNYNERLVGASGANVTRTDMGRSDVYVWVPATSSWTAPAGFYDKLEYQAGPDTFTITDRHKTVRTFVNRGGTYKLSTIADPNGNTLTMGYNASHQLVTVTDTLSRVINFVYTAEGRIDYFTDFYDAVTPRKVDFTYDANGDLQKVTSPVVTGTPNGNDFPLGKTTEYSYTSGSPSSWLNHNLLTIKDPKLQTFLVNTFGMGTDRVDTQRYGTASQNYTFTYNSGSTRVLDRAGNQTDYNYNANGNATSIVEYTNRGVRAGEGDYTTSFTYNANFEMLSYTEPRGNGVVNTFDITNSNPLARGNLLEISQHDGPVGTLPDIVTTMTYEGTFQQVKTLVKRGFTTTFWYDYEEATSGDKNGDGITTQANGNRVLTSYPHITDPLPQDIEEKVWYNSNGQPTRFIGGEGFPTTFDYYASGPQTGYLQKITVAFGTLNYATEFTYDTVGNVLTVKDPRLFTTTYFVNQLNEVVRQTLPIANYQIEWVRDANGNITDVNTAWINGDGFPEAGSPLSTTFAYNILNDVTSVVQEVVPGTITTSYTFDNNQNLQRTDFPAGNATFAVFDERDLVYTSTRGYGTADASTETLTYDGSRNVTELLHGEAGNHKTTYVSDGFNRREKETDGAGNHTDIEYYECCSFVKFVRRYQGAGIGTLLAETHSYIDEINRTYKQESLHKNSAGTPVGSDGLSRTTFQFDKNSRLQETTDDRGNHTTNTYNQADHLTNVVDALGSVGNSIAYVRDGNGNATQATSTEYNQRLAAPESFVVSYNFDALNRMTTMTEDPGGLAQASTYKYSSLGALVSLTDAENHTTKSVTDGLARVTQKTYDFGGASATTISQAWNGNSLLTSQTDDNGHATGYEYTFRDQVKKITYADLTTKVLTYDKDDNLKTVTDEVNNVVTNTYDDRDLMTQRDISRGTGVVGTTQEVYTFDGANRMTSALNKNGVDPISLVTMYYDTLSNVDKVEETYFGGTMRTLTATVDNDGNRLTLGYPSGRMITCEWDAINRPTTVREGASNIATYLWAGRRVAKRTLLNGVYLEVTYNAVKDATTWANKLAGADVATFGYAFDKVHNRKFEKRIHDAKADVYRRNGRYEEDGFKYGVPSAEIDPTKDYTAYPNFDRQQTKEYDGVGNRKTMVDAVTGGATDTYEYNRPAGGGAYAADSVNRIYRVRKNGVDENFSNSNGNRTGDGTYTYSYNYKNELIETRLVSDGSLVQGNNYNCAGIRIFKDFTGTANDVYFYTDGPRVVEERDASGTVLATYVFGDWIDETLTMTRGGNTYYYSQQALYSVVHISDASGGNVEKMQYDGFGTPTIYHWIPIFGGGGNWNAVSASLIGNPFMFTGREYDSATKSYYYRARQLDSLHGRFTTRDPIPNSLCGEGDLLNQYTYVLNRPTGMVDPSGLVGIAEWILALAAGGDAPAAAGAGAAGGLGLAVGVLIFGPPLIEAAARERLAQEQLNYWRERAADAVRKALRTRPRIDPVPPKPPPPFDPPPTRRCVDDHPNWPLCSQLPFRNSEAARVWIALIAGVPVHDARNVPNANRPPPFGPQGDPLQDMYDVIQISNGRVLGEIDCSQCCTPDLEGWGCRAINLVIDAQLPEISDFGE